MTDLDHFIISIGESADIVSNASASVLKLIVASEPSLLIPFNVRLNWLFTIKRI